MKLSWRDIATTALAIFGGAIVYAKFYDYSWAVIGSWRSAVAVLALTGIAMALLSAFDVTNRSILNITEMILAVVAIGVAAVGVIITSPVLFYTLAGLIGVVWLIDTGRHVYHSVTEEGEITTSRHAPVH